MSKHIHSFLLLSTSLLTSVSAAPTPAESTQTSSPVIELGRYEVNASPIHSPASTLLTSVTIAGYDQLANESVDYPLELLGKIPGLTLTDFNQGVITADISIRGFNGEGSSPHLRLLVDGIPHNLNNGYNDLSPIFPLEIERIEAVKGTADPRFGQNAVAGSVNVHTFQAFEGQKIKLMAGSYGTQEGQAIAGFTHDRFTQTYFVGVRHSDGYRDHATIDKHSFSGKWFYTGSEDLWRLGLSARIHAFEADAPGYLSFAQSRSQPKSSPAFSNTDGGTQDNLQFSLHGDLNPHPDFTVSAKTYAHEVQRQRFVRFTAAGSQQERYEDEVHSGLITSARWQPDNPLSFALDAGAEYHRQDADNQRYSTASRARTAATRNHNYLLENTGAHLGAEIRPVSPVRLTAGLRADRYDGEFLNRTSGARTPIIDYGTLWQPKLGASCQFLPQAQLYGSYGRAFQVGSGSSAYSTKPLEASQNDGYEIGLHTTPRKNLTARLALWRQTASDELKTKADGSGDLENIGSTLREGADLEITWRLRPELSLWASYTIQEGIITNPGANPADAPLRDNEIDHVPDFTYKAGADWDATKALTFSASLLGQGDYHLTTRNNNGRWGDYTLLNLDARYRWKKVTFGASVKNVFDRYHEYVWFDGAQTLHSPGDGRGFYGTVTIEF